LSKDEVEKVRQDLASNIKLPKPLFAVLSKDPSENVSFALVANPLCTAEALNEVSYNRDGVLRRNLLSRADLPVDAIQIMAGNSGDTLR
ncbi:hypothetical protein ABTE11_22170, partial [Acinetobacter baumannii]